MQMRASNWVGIVAGAGIAALVGTPAVAECTRLGFSVNDYGKDGPTKDAKELLDKHIAKTMAERGVSKYTVGKKDVTCELFLNLIVVDEHTCKAEATVCWGGAQAKKSEAAAPAAAKPVAKAAPAAPPAKPKTAASPPPKPVVETGALPDNMDDSAAEKAAAAADAAERAAAAAERAAAAAERAAAAAAPTAIRTQSAPASAATTGAIGTSPSPVKPQ